MLYAWVDGIKRAPFRKGESTSCRDCGGSLTSVMPVQNVPHWRHKAGDCDSWSEPEGPWHLTWKNAFPLECREVPLIDPLTGERHRADVLCGAGTSAATVLELQNSPISDDELNSREAFYRQSHRMFWLVHIYDGTTSFTGTNFWLSQDWRSHVVIIHEKKFALMSWAGRSSQFIEKWKRANAHVFFDYKGHIFFLAGNKLSEDVAGGRKLKKREFVLNILSPDNFISAVKEPR